MSGKSSFYECEVKVRQQGGIGFLQFFLRQGGVLHALRRFFSVAAGVFENAVADYASSMS
jgi:hypothetical protein